MVLLEVNKYVVFHDGLTVLIFVVVDIDTLAALLEEDEDLSVKPPSSKPSGDDGNSENDALKRKLEEMEKQMALLKQQLSVQSPPGKPAPIKEAGIDFSNPTPSSSSSQVSTNTAASQIHQGDTDSSEDEEGNRKTTSSYNEFGQFVRKRLAHQSEEATDRLKGTNVPQGWKSKQGALTNLSKPSVKPVEQGSSGDGNGFTDPFFGIKILNPLIGSTTLAQRMEGRKQIRASQIRSHMRGGDIKVRRFTFLFVSRQYFIPFFMPSRTTG